MLKSNLHAIILYRENYSKLGLRNVAGITKNVILAVFGNICRETDIVRHVQRREVDYLVLERGLVHLDAHFFTGTEIP